MDQMALLMWINQLDDISLKIKRDSIVFHYTSPDGLLGIIKNKKIQLRFGRVDCLNDYSEGQEILEIYRQVCEDLHDEGKIDESFFKKIITITPDTKTWFNLKTEYGTSGRKIERVCYVCCFSRKKDSLPMWNYYVKNNKYQGYNLGFGLNELNEELRALETVNISFDIKPVKFETIPSRLERK